MQVPTPVDRADVGSATRAQDTTATPTISTPTPLLEPRERYDDIPTPPQLAVEDLDEANEVATLAALIVDRWFFPPERIATFGDLAAELEQVLSVEFHRSWIDRSSEPLYSQRGRVEIGVIVTDELTASRAMVGVETIRGDSAHWLVLVFERSLSGWRLVDVQ